NCAAEACFAPFERRGSPDPRGSCHSLRARAYGKTQRESIVSLMIKLTIELPEEALSALRETPERFALEMRFAAAVQWYHQGLISGSKAAQIAGMTRLEFLDELARRRLDVIKVDLEELRREISGA